MTQQQETPERIASLLGVAMASMFFLFAVATSNANFNKLENPFPDPFSPDKVMASLDNVSNSYSNFIADMSKPMEQSLAILQDNVNYVIDNSSEQILAFTGLSSLAVVPDNDQPAASQVAGASTQVVYSEDYPSSSNIGLNMDLLYGLLMPR